MVPGLDPADLPADAIEVGRVADAWGVKGWFKVLPFSADPAALLFSRQWFLVPGHRGERALPGAYRLTITEARRHSDAVVACAQGLLDRQGAEELRGTRVFVSRRQFPQVGADEYYWVDLIGLEVINRQGLTLGRVDDLLATGAQTVLRLRQTVGDGIIERMIPFVGAYIDRVDLDARRILVDWQADY